VDNYLGITYLQYNNYYKARVTMDICHDGPTRFINTWSCRTKNYRNT